MWVGNVKEKNRDRTHLNCLLSVHYGEFSNCLSGWVVRPWCSNRVLVLRGWVGDWGYRTDRILLLFRRYLRLFSIIFITNTQNSHTQLSVSLLEIKSWKGLCILFSLSSSSNSHVPSWWSSCWWIILWNSSRNEGEMKMLNVLIKCVQFFFIPLKCSCTDYSKTYRKQWHWSTHIRKIICSTAHIDVINNTLIRLEITDTHRNTINFLKTSINYKCIQIITCHSLASGDSSA